MDSEIGKMALVGDVWYEILEIRFIYGRKEYRLSTKEYWTPNDWVEKVREKHEI